MDEQINYDILEENLENNDEINDQNEEEKLTSPGQLQDVTMDNYSVVGYRSPCISLQHNGTTSPGQGRSVREFEEQMAALKKENFNLRLRIYFLEEKLSGGYNQMATPEGQESLMKQYIDNKVETEILLKDVDEKQKLLMEAAQAMTHMENIQKDTQKKNQEIIDELNQRIQFLEMENKELEKATNSDNINFLATPKDIDSLQRVRELEGVVRQFEDKNDELNMKIQEFQEQINEKNEIVQDIESKLKQLNFQNAELQEQFENKEKEIATASRKSVEVSKILSEKETLNNQLNERNEILLNENKQLVKTIETRTQDFINQTNGLEDKKIKIQQQQDLMNDMHTQKLRDELHEYKVKLADKICLVDELEGTIKEKSMSNEKACQAIQKLMITIKEIQNENERLKKNSPDNISQAKEPTYESNSTALCKSLSDIEGMSDISILKGKFTKAIGEKNLQIRKLEDEIKKKTSNLQTVVNKELWEKKRAIENLTKLFNKLNANHPSSSSPINITNTEQLQQSFTDTEFSAAVVQNKLLQKKVDKVIQKLNSIDPIEIIQQFKLEAREARFDAEQAHKWRKECTEGCAILTQRLEELAGFLDSLLQHKDVLNGLASDRRRAMRKAIDRSLDLSRSLNNMSMSLSGISLNESSLIQLSNISGILASNNTENKENKTFNSHEELSQINSIASTGTQSQVDILKAQVQALKKELEKQKLNESVKKDRKSLPLKLEMQSESEAWSEPDRNVSFARIGLEELNAVPKIKKSKEEENNSSSASETDLNRRSKSKTLEKMSLLEEIIAQKDNKILEIQCELVDADNRLKKENLKMLDINRELNEYRSVNEMLEIEIASFKNQSIVYEKFKVTEETLRKEILDKSQYIEKIQEDRDRLNIEAKVAAIQIESLKNEIGELKIKHEKNLELLKEEEKNKFNQLHKDLQANLEFKLKEQESKHQEYLQRDWISRIIYEDSRRDLELIQKKLCEAQSTIDYLNENESELKANLIENEKAMRASKKSLDESTLTASKAVLERTKATNEKLKLEDRMAELSKELETAENEKLSFKERIDTLEKANNNLNKKLLIVNNSNNNKPGKLLSTSGSDGQSGYTSEEIPNNGKKSLIANEQRLENSSPDLGIESDPGRICIAQKVNISQNSKLKPSEKPAEINNDKDDINGNTDTNKENIPLTNEIFSDDHECAKVFQENVELRHKLKRTRRQYEDTLKLLRTANQKKEQVERDIRQQIVKTHVVLKNVRTNMETELQLKKKD